MATGAFGRRPRLNNNSNQAAIQARYKQAQDAEWSAMQDAWKNGGMINGEPVTDQMILDYMTKRRDEIGAPTGGEAPDPAYTQWSNNVSQLKFSIAESKVGVQFKEGKMSAAQVATFYKDQLSNLPQDSEIYRTVAAKAADWAKSASASGGASASAAAMKALTARRNANDATIASYGNLRDVIVQAAINAGLVPPNGDLSKIIDVAGFQALLDSGTIINPATNKAVTASDWRGAQLGVYRAYDDNVAVYTQAGQPDNAQTEIGKKGDFVSKEILTTNSLGIEEQYQAARDQFVADKEAAQGNPEALRVAAAKYGTRLGVIYGNAVGLGTNPDGTKDPLKTASPTVVGSLKNEWDIYSGKVTDPNKAGVTLGGIMTGDGSDGATSVVSLNKTAEQQAAIDRGDAIYGQASPTSPMGPIVASEVKGATLLTSGPGAGTYKLPDNYQATTITVGGQKVTGWVAGAPMYQAALVKQNANGEWVAMSSADIAAAGGVAKALASGAQVDRDHAALIGYTYINPATGKPGQYGTYVGGVQVMTTADPRVGDTTPDGYTIIGAKNVTQPGKQTPTLQFEQTPVTNVIPPGQAPTDPNQIPGSAEIDFTRPVEQSVASTAAVVGRWAGAGGALNGTGTGNPATPASRKGYGPFVPQDAYGPPTADNSWLHAEAPSTGQAGQSLNIGGVRLFGSMSADTGSAASGGLRPAAATLPTPTISLPHYPGISDPSRSPNAAPLAPGTGLGAPTPWISLPSMPGFTPPVLPDPSRNPLGPLAPTGTSPSDPGGSGLNRNRVRAV